MDTKTSPVKGNGLVTDPLCYIMPPASTAAAVAPVTETTAVGSCIYASGLEIQKSKYLNDTKAVTLEQCKASCDAKSAWCVAYEWNQDRVTCRVFNTLTLELKGSGVATEGNCFI
jgi:hypothetical protein